MPCPVIVCEEPLRIRHVSTGKRCCVRQREIIITTKSVEVVNYCRCAAFQITSDVYTTTFLTKRAVEESAALGEQGCYPRYIQNSQQEFQLPNAFLVKGKDRDGNYWIQGHMVKGRWGRIAALLEGEGKW